MANTVLSVFNLKKTFELEPIFAGVTFQLNEGDKAALVGVNGAGKTTILEIVAGIDSADTGGGSVVKSRGLRVAYLPQEVSGFGQIAADHQLAPETTLWDAMLDALGSINDLQQQMRLLEEEMSAPGVEGPLFDRLIARYEEVTGRFEQAGGYELEHKIDQVLEGLGFSRAQFELPIVKLSGGQKTRAALGRALLADPDLLLLDEPTNHLDLVAIEWLESFLTGWRGTLLCSSHDRRFLDRVTTRTLELEFGRLEDYPGNYTKYLGLKAERTERQLMEYQQQQEFIARQAEFIRRYKNSQKTRQAKGREKRLNRLERKDAPRSGEQLKLELKAHVRSGRSVLAIEDLEVGFRVPAATDHPAATSGNGSAEGGKLMLIRAPDLEIERGERVALIGPNGAGKTTLLRTILGELEPLRGEVIVGHNVRVAYYAQAHEGLKPEREIIDEIMMARPMSEEAARTLLGRFLFSGDDVFKRIGDLSGGERSRVALAKLTLADANFLLLDEPTNHLDLGAREALEDVLSEYKGTLLFVSHDRAFIDSLASQVWLVAEGRIEAFDGNYTDYQEELARRRRDAALPEVDRRGDARGPAIKIPQAKPPANGNGATHTIPKGIPGGQQGRRDQRAREEADRVAARARAVAERQIRDIETAISDLEARLNLLSGELEAASAAGDLALVADVGREYQTLADELEQKYSAWEVLAG